MTTTLAVTIAGGSDQHVEKVVESCGISATRIKIDQLAALAEPRAAQPTIVLVDIRDRGALPPSVAALRRQHPSTGVIIVASTLEPALMLEAMRSGVTEFLTMPISAIDLQAAMGRVAAVAVPTTAAGQVFAFLGAKGGVGTTTVAVNVATALSQIAPGSTLLIDLHLAYGDAAVYLGTEPRFSVVDALENVQRLDKTFLSGLVGHAKAGLAFLASSDRASVTPVDAATVQALIEAASHHYQYIVLDVPRSEAFLDALEPCARIVVVANQELATVRAATRLSAALRQRYGKDRLTVVVSRFDSHSEIGSSDVERVLGSPVAHTFPSNYRVALDALNAGRPVVLDNHNKLAASLTGFARHLVDGSESATPAKKKPAGLLGLITGRRA